MQNVQPVDRPILRNSYGCDVILLRPTAERDDGVLSDAVLKDLEPEAPDITQTPDAAAQEGNGGVAGLR